MSKKLISLVLPAYNEEKNISLIYNELLKILSTINNKYEFEIIFINDWSNDHTWSEIVKLSQKNKNIVWINFSRNFWKEIALTAWVEKSSWNAVITMDVDWQHPVEKIPDFLKKWEEWYEIVYNVRPKIKWASILKKITSRVFYKIFNSISDIKMEAWTTDYRLLDKKVVEVFLSFTERNRLYRWIVDMIGFNKACLVFDALPNPVWRKPSYNYLKLYHLAINSLTSFSIFPLKLVGYIWFIITTTSTLLFIVMLLDKLWVLNLQFTNLALVVVLNTIFIWIVLMSLWLMSLYIARIHEEVIWRPLYIIKDKINLK